MSNVINPLEFVLASHNIHDFLRQALDVSGARRRFDLDPEALEILGLPLRFASDLSLVFGCIAHFACYVQGLGRRLHVIAAVMLISAMEGSISGDLCTGSRRVGLCLCR